MLGFRRLRRCGVLALLLGPVLLWALLVAVAPTGWARDRVAGALGRATRQPVGLGSVSLGWLGDVRLGDLALGAPDPDDGPWLQARELSLDLNLWDLVRGRTQPGRCLARGVTLRVRHRGDGRFEWDDLLSHPRDGSARTHAPSEDDDRPLLALELEDARLIVADDPSGCRLELTGVRGQGTWSESGLEVEQLTGAVNGGRVDLACRLDRDGPGLGFEGELRVEDAGLQGAVRLLALLAPALAGAPEGLGGQLDLDLKLRGQCESLEALRATAAGQGAITLSELGPDDSRILATITRAFHLPARDAVGSLRGDFLVSDATVATENLTLQIGPLPIRLEGTTGFDGRLDYTLHAEPVRQRLGALGDRLPDEARRLLDDLSPAVDRLATLRLQGTLSAPALTADGEPWEKWVEKAIEPGSPEAEKLRQLGRRLRGRDRAVR